MDEYLFDNLPVDVGIAHLLEASIKLGYELETSARALLYYHHFMECVGQNQYDKNMIAAAVLSLSARINEKNIDEDSLISVFFSIANKSEGLLIPDDVAFMQLKKSLIAMDFLILRSLEFNLRHFLAHQYFIPFITLICERSKYLAQFRTSISNCCLRLLSDFYCTKNALNYQPQIIAIACIDLALYVLGFIFDTEMIAPWYMGFCSDISSDKIKQIKKDILLMYHSKPFRLKNRSSSAITNTANE